MLSTIAWRSTAHLREPTLGRVISVEWQRMDVDNCDHQSIYDDRNVGMSHSFVRTIPATKTTVDSLPSLEHVSSHGSAKDGLTNPCKIRLLRLL